MPVHIENMTQDITMMDGNTPLSEPQMRVLVQRVIQELEHRERNSKRSQEATTLRSEAAPHSRGWSKP
jgi:hypothetical protein